MCCINIHFTVYPFTFYKYSIICKLLYITVTHYQNKTLYNLMVSAVNLNIRYCEHCITYVNTISNIYMNMNIYVFFGTKSTDLLMFSHVNRTHPKSIM